MISRLTVDKVHLFSYLSCLPEKWTGARFHHKTNFLRFMKSTIADLLRHKGTYVLTIEKNATVYEAIEKMEHSRVGSIIVLEGEDVVGIFTERDYLRRIVLKGRTSKTTRVHEVMSEELVVVDPSYSIQECMAVMTERKLRHLPVIDDGKLAGIVSIGDLVKTISDDAQARVHYLTDYIMGKYPA